MLLQLRLAMRIAGLRNPAARIALGAEEWIAAIEDALSEDGKEKAVWRKSFVEGYDVRQAARQFEAVILHAVQVSNSSMP